MDCEAILKFYVNKNIKRISQPGWLAFKDRIINSAYKVKFEHIKGIDNGLTNTLSRNLLNRNQVM